MKELTPEHLRCAIGTCPAIYEDGDRIIIRGKFAFWEEFPDLPKCELDEGYIYVPRSFYDALIAAKEQR